MEKSYPANNLKPSGNIPKTTYRPTKTFLPPQDLRDLRENTLSIFRNLGALHYGKCTIINMKEENVPALLKTVIIFVIIDPVDNSLMQICIYHTFI